jgi:hypothetical protein
MSRKTILALFAIALVGMLSPAVASARGGLVEVAFTEVVAVFAAALVEEGSGVEASRAVVAGVGWLAHWCLGMARTGLRSRGRWLRSGSRQRLLW